ncbi:DNA-directed RNA polymerase [Cryptotrichosporon argae]
MSLAGRPLLHLPSPLPLDVTPSRTTPQADLYHSTALIDRVTLISICLRRPAHVPRAYQIFRALLDEAAAGGPVPDADVWGHVIRGVAELGRHTDGVADAAEASPHVKSHAWAARAAKLVGEWEELHGADPGVRPVLERGGAAVYRGFFAGSVLGVKGAGVAVEAAAPLVPYLRDGWVGAPTLVDGLREAELPAAYDALSEIAKVHAIGDLGDQVDALRGEEKAKREAVAREVVEAVNPVMESRKLRKLSAQQDGEQAPTERFAISNLRTALESISGAQLAYNRQTKLEAAAYDAARKELEHAAALLHAVGDGSAGDAAALQRRQLQAWMHEWLGALTARLRADISAMGERVRSAPEAGQFDADAPKWKATSTIKESTLELYLGLLPADKLALITILELMRMVGAGGITDGMKILRGCTAVGRAVENEYRADTIRNVAGADSSEWLATIDPQTQKPSRMLISTVWSRLGKQLKDREGSEAYEDLKAVWTPPWTQQAQVAVGSYLISSLLEVAKVQRSVTGPEGETVTEEQPAFAHAYEYVRGKKLGIIRLNPVVAARLANDAIGPVIQPKHLPMLVPPKVWSAHDDGGYLHNRLSIMRFKQSQEQRQWLRAASDRGDLEPVFHGLDVLSSTPWAINRRVFDIVLQAWNSGDAIADIPASEANSTVVFPVKPDASDHDPRRRAVYIDEFKMATQQARKNHAERCKYNYMLEIARAYLHDTFYIPHNMDFRGRAYPIPPHLSPVGDDLCRGLLTFGVKKPLGKQGLKWLRIHLANVYGYDKASFEERARFAVDHEADVFDAADDPLGGRRWWLQAEDPWQCLAACVDLAAALRAPDPEAYESSLPVHQDGTCNGMQHYAALGGDVRGAKAVNLENGDRPADIYTGVADLVNAAIAKDKQDGVPLALMLKEPLGRKVVKQTVMTTVYGVTFIGARDQIARQLTARGDVGGEHLFHVSAYIAKKVLGCIGDLFSGARAIQDWLTISARLIARSVPAERVDESVRPLESGAGPGARTKNRAARTRLLRELMTSVIWTTPLGLPVVQPYRKLVKKQVMTALQTVYIHDPNANAEVSPQKQATAFPPNFIHSLDATHMLLTAVECRNHKVTFASVHDSYWTHASTVDTMATHIRDCFIKLHSQDLVGGLRDEFLHRYGNNGIPIENAKSISRSAAKRKAANAQMSFLGDAVEADAEAEVEAATAAAGNTDPFSTSLSTDDAVDAALDADADPEGADATPTLMAESDIPVASAPVEVIGGQKFVRFRDVLPPAPAKGQFDVSRIKDSAYFFS